MPTTDRLFAALTAGDLMSREVITIPLEMAMRDAAQLLLRYQVSGAPVVDANGRCVGIVSATDFVQRAERTQTADAPAPARPVTCGFQEQTWDSAGRQVVVCQLPCGVCPLQQPDTGPAGEARSVCSDPHCVPTDWQVVNVEQPPTDSVRRYMTTDLVTADVQTRISDLARRMLDAHLHRLIVVDEQLRPVGVVSSTDVLAAVAYAERASGCGIRNVVC